jgi:type I restriction enzyme S subunit
VLRADKRNLLPKYLQFQISKSRFFEYLSKVQVGTAYPSVSDKNIRNFSIPLPPLSEQERIVNILDRFDKLTNDISVGLPAEIAARHKQYEYYRDTLLSFKEKVS